MTHVVQFKKAKSQGKVVSDEDKETTRVQDMLQARDAKKMAKAYVFDLQHYLFFSLVFSLSCFGARFGNTQAFYFGEIFKSKLQTEAYFKVIDPPTMWSYIERDVLPTLYQTHRYNGDELPEYQIGSVLRQNRLIGGVRFRSTC